MHRASRQLGATHSISRYHMGVAIPATGHQLIRHSGHYPTRSMHARNLCEYRMVTQNAGRCHLPAQGAAATSFLCVLALAANPHPSNTPDPIPHPPCTHSPCCLPGFGTRILGAAMYLLASAPLICSFGIGPITVNCGHSGCCIQQSSNCFVCLSPDLPRTCSTERGCTVAANLTEPGAAAAVPGCCASCAVGC